MNERYQRMMVILFSSILVFAVGLNRGNAATPSAVTKPVMAKPQSTSQAPNSRVEQQKQARAVLGYVSKVAPQLYHYDHKNYNQQFKQLEKSFSQAGWRYFLGRLSRDGELQRVRAQKLSLVARLLARPRILARREISGEVIWAVQAPLAVQYTKTDTKQKQVNRVLLNLTVTSKQMNGQPHYQISRVYVRQLPMRKSSSGSKRSAAPAKSQ